MKKILLNSLVLSALIVPGILFAGSAVLAAATTGNPPAQATTGNPPADASGSGGSGLANPLSVSSFPEFLTAILKGVVELGAIFLTVMIVYVGFLFVAAQGNAEKLSSARTALIWTVIGGLILLGAEGISLVIQNTVSSITS